MKITVENNFSNLQTSNTQLLKILRKKYSAKIPGANYSSAFRRGWDGRKYFFSKKGKFGTGMLPLILADLEYVGITPEIQDLREKCPLQNFHLPGMKLRDYQEYLVKKALEAQGCVIKSPTGSGKTLILGAILKALEGKPGLVFFTKKQLLYQTYKELTKWGFDVGVAFGEGVDIKPLTLCTAQSVDKILDSHLKKAKFIIFDEVHEFSKGKLTTKILKSFPAARYRIGMTATVPTDSIAKLNLISSLGQTIEEVRAPELVNAGFLTKPIIQMIPIKDKRDVDDVSLSYQDIYEKYISTNDDRNYVIQTLSHKISKKPSKTLILVKDLGHAEKLHQLIPNSFKLEGKNSIIEREEVVKKFKEQDSAVIIGTTILQTGIDIPEITHLINARGLKSEIATLQALGRALRIHKSKTQVFVYDFFDRAPYLEKHAKSRIASYKSLGFEVNYEK
jgi:DNA repair protein RadD